MAWRYYAPHPLWEGSRSFVLQQDGQIAAHVAAVPGLLQTSSGPKLGLHFIDWAADPTAMMAGAGVLKKLMRRGEWTICVGGSADNRRLLPLLGFQAAPNLQVWAKPLRPLVQIATHQTRDWRLPARLARNTLWALSGRRTAGWIAAPAEPEAIPESLWVPRECGAASVRSAALIRYFLACPAPKFSFWALQFQGRLAGAALTATVVRQARICDLWLDEPGIDAAAGALGAVLDALRRESTAAEATLWGSTPEVSAAARICGFQPALEKPVMVHPAGLLEEKSIDINMIANDAAYLNDGAPGYLT